MQGDALNHSRIATVVCVPLTSNLRWSNAPGNVPLAARLTGLPKDSVANVSQIVILDRDLEWAGFHALRWNSLQAINIILGR